MQRKIKLSFIAMALTIALLATVLAAFMMTKTLTNTFNVGSNGNFKIVREDNINIEVASIDWGTIAPGTNESSLDILGTRISLYDTGNLGLAFYWNVTGLPAGFNLLLYENGKGWIPENGLIGTCTPGTEDGLMIFYLVSTNPLQPPATSSFTININAVQN